MKPTKSSFEVINNKLYDLRGGGSESGYDRGGYNSYYDDGGGYSNNNDNNYDYRQEQSTSQQNRRNNNPGGRGYGEYDENRDGMYYDDDDYYYNNEEQQSPGGAGRGAAAARAAGTAAFDAATSAANIVTSLPNIIRHGDRKVGFALLGSGAVVTFLGISLFFNKTLMRLGNLLLIAGIPVLLGPTRTIGYFVQPQKARATGCLAFGIFLVFIGSPIFGILLEIFGLLNLFGNMFPVVWAIVKQMPVIGPILKGNGGSNNNNNGNNNSRRRRSRYTYDEDGDDYDYQNDYPQDNFDEYNRRSKGGYNEQRYDSYDDGYNSYNSNSRYGY